MTLRSNDPRDTPHINFNYFEEGNDPNKGKEDLDAMVEAIAFIRKIMNRLSRKGKPKRSGLDRTFQITHCGNGL